jgi:uncharacterized protein (TIGR01319 family)
MNKKASHGFFVDFGSTFTKLTLIDFDHEEIVGRTQSPSTVDRDIMLGLNAALESLREVRKAEPTSRCKLACSSAAGGLRMVAIGLVPELTVEAGKRAALGAGAKVVGIYAYQMTRKELEELEGIAPDIILLAGGTDGGDQETILRNATNLSKSDVQSPIVVAGNKVVSDEIQRILEIGNKECIITENVMPEIGILRVDKVRSIIREVFINRIIESKGLRRAEEFVDGILMPTPTAVLTAARLLSQGTGSEEGLGELVVVDIGGATTDIHSIGRGDPTEPGVVQKGLPEPFVKRTVEGDLGLRYNASSILGAVGEEHLTAQLGNSDLDLEEAVDHLSRVPASLPKSASEWSLDTELARAAARLAMERHAGIIEPAYGPQGQILIQYGKDLRRIKTVIGTGGPLVFSPAPEKILEGMVFSETNPFSLKPKMPDFYLDHKYMLYAIGLMSEVEPEKALRVAKKHLLRI